MFQGIVEPVQAHKRGGRGAIGHYGSEKPKNKESLVSFKKIFFHFTLLKKED